MSHSVEVTAYLERLSQEDPYRAELAQGLEGRMLELWAVAESRRSAADPRWHAFEDRKTAPQPDELRQWAAGTWPERWAVALEPHTPRELLERLAHDPVDFIARLCQKRLATAASPLPERVELVMNQTGEPAMDVGEGDRPWVEALQRLQRRVQAGEAAMEEAIRFVEALDASWVSSALSKVMEHEEAPQDLEETPETLVQYAHLLPEYLSNLDSQYDGAAIFHERVTESGILTPLPVHPHFTDGELLEWLSFAGRPGISESDWCRMAFDPPEYFEGRDVGDASPFPGGALWSVWTGGYLSSEVVLLLDDSRYPEGAQAFVAWWALEAIWPGHYA